jgi:hypothetical protein
VWAVAGPVVSDVINAQRIKEDQQLIGGASHQKVVIGSALVVRVRYKPYTLVQLYLDQTTHGKFYVGKTKH